MDYYSYYDEGTYCSECDESWYGDYTHIPVDQWREKAACPVCGHVYPEIYINDHFFEFGMYLLSPADDDFVCPEPRIHLPDYAS